MSRTREYAPNRIREWRLARGLSMEGLGGAMANDLTASTIAKLEGRKMALSADYLLDIANVLQVSPGDLLLNGSGARMLPVVGKIAAGDWREAVGLSEESIPVPDHLHGANLFVLRQCGDSMDRIVPEGVDGGFIVVDPDQRDLIDRKFYVVMNEHNETTFKQFSQNPLALLPCSNNADCQPIPIGSAPFTVIGRVIYVGQML
jgi:repressor LexA